MATCSDDDVMQSYLICNDYNNKRVFMLEHCYHCDLKTHPQSYQNNQIRFIAKWKRATHVNSMRFVENYCKDQKTK